MPVVPEREDGEELLDLRLQHLALDPAQAPHEL